MIESTLKEMIRKILEIENRDCIEIIRKYIQLELLLFKIDDIH